MRALDRLLQTVLIIMAFAILTGGGTPNFFGVKVEISSVDAWALSLTLILFALSFKKDITQLKAWKWLENFVEKLKGLSTTRNFLLISFGLLALIFIAHTFRHLSYNTHALDSSYVNQSLFYPFTDFLLKCDLCNGSNRLSNHLGFSLFLITPLTMLIKSEIFIIFLEVFLVGGALIALIKYGPLAKRKDLWLYAFFLFFAHRAFRGGIMWDFKEDHLGEMFLFLTFLFLYKRQLIPFVLTFFGALISKEHTPFIFPLLAIPLWFEKDLPYNKQERIRLILFILLASFVWALAIFQIFFPLFNPEDSGHGRPPLVARLGIPGETKSEILMNLFFNPVTWWQLLKEKVLTVGALKYVFLLYLPFVYFLRKRWWWIAATLSVLAMNLVSTFWTMRTMAYHYECFLLPSLFFGTLLALKEAKKSTFLVWGLILMLSTSGRWPGFPLRTYFPTLGQVKDTRFFSQLPNRGVYYAGGNVLPHISTMREIREIKYPKGNPTEDQKQNFEALTEVNEGILQKANHVLIEKEKKWERVMRKYLVKNGFELEKKSPSQQILYLKKNPSG